MIEVRDVTKQYGTKSGAFHALRGVSFQIPLGASVAIVGKSGSGKSTLMHLMGGLDRPTGGDIFIKGKPMSGLSRRAMDRFRARDLGFVFQSFFVEGNQTCYQNVALPLEINGVPRRKRRQRVEQALQQVGLFEKINAKARTLSGGQKQRLAIARAIVMGPRIIMADEPTGNLDSSNGDKVIELLFGLNRSLRSTLVIVTHDAELAARCQYRITLKDGKVVSMESPADAAPVARTGRAAGLAGATKQAAKAVARPVAKAIGAAKAAIQPAKGSVKPGAPQTPPAPVRKLPAKPAGSPKQASPAAAAKPARKRRLSL